MQCYCRIAACAILAFASRAEAQLKVEPDPRNLVATRIEGEWEVDVELSTRLNDKHPKAPRRMAFANDPTVLEKIPPQFVAEIEKAKVRIYLAGTLQEGNAEKLFLLTVWSGNSVVITFSRRDDGTWTNNGDGALMIATGRDRQDDLLFSCESYEDIDMLEKPSVAYRRLKQVEKKE
jgi:hypothetical protein